jgi:DNA-binding NarL/FixJ family response regulator
MNDQAGSLGAATERMKGTDAAAIRDDSAVKPGDPPPRPVARILLVDDHPIFRAGARMLLERDPQLTVIGEAAGDQEALALAAREQPDLVLLDLDLGGVDGLDILESLQAAAPRSRIIVLTGVCGSELPLRALRLGARGFVPKGQSADLLLRAIRRVRDGELWFDRGIVGSEMTRLMRPSDVEAGTKLTPRELEIVRLIGDGLSNDEIATRLGISGKTVRNHLTIVFEKTGARDRLHLAIHAYRQGLAKLP